MIVSFRDRETEAIWRVSLVGGCCAIFKWWRCGNADTDLRLARYFGLSDGFWLGIQADYELMERRRQIGERLARIARRASAA